MVYQPQMYQVIVQDHFSAAHQLRGLDGVCENLHGHNWKVDVVVEAQTLDSWGCVVDFHWVEKELKEILDQFDHQILNEIPYFQDVNPSAENVARFCFEELSRKLENLSHPEGEHTRVKKVTIWETDRLGASFYA